MRGKLGEFCYHKTKKLGKNRNFGVMSEIQRARLEVLVACIFGGKIWGSDRNFRGKFWGQAPRPPNMEVPHGFNWLFGVCEHINHEGIVLPASFFTF